MDNKKLGAFILLLIGIIVSLALLTPTADRVQEMTEKLQITNESIGLSAARDAANKTINSTHTFTVSKNPTGWRIRKCPITSIVFGNESTNYTVTTDYTVNASGGILTVLNSSNTFWGGNDTAIDYQYCTTGYIADGAGRAVTRLILTFAGLAIIAFAIYYGIKEWL